MNRWYEKDFDPELLEPGSLRIKQPQKLAVSSKGMVSSQHYLATDAGVQILAEDGNAIDAAITSALASCVCEPAACGLGGQTFLIVHIAKRRRTFILDGSSFAPHRAIPGTVTKEDRRRGYKACTVPTTPRVLSYALEKYGTCSWERVLHPAINLARDGFTVSPLLSGLFKRDLKYLREGTASTHLLKKGKYRYRTGERFRQPVLAKTLELLAKNGVDDFYTGKIAKLIHKDMVRNGGLIRQDDLAQVQPPLERRPIACWFDGLRVMTMPPPGAGRTLIEMLNIISSLPKKYRHLATPESASMIARIMRQAYRDRRDRAFDPNFYAQVSDRKMSSPDYARRIAKRIRSRGETTHLSVMDKYGNVVGLTQSIERVFGSCCASEELGFLYNNYLMAYDYDDMCHPYHLRPAAVPWASVAPTIIFEGKSPWLAVGSPGGERITASIFQVLLRLQKQSLFEAVDAPRMYCDINGRVSLESPRMRDDIPVYLEKDGFTIDHRSPYSFYMGCIQMVMRDGDHFIGVADPRRDGAAGGPRLSI